MLHLDADRRLSGEYADILHDDYMELGQSGRVTRKSDYVVFKMPESDFEVIDYRVKDLSDNSKLATYILMDKVTNNKSNRSSIWVNEDGWKLYFHQGTKVN
ncbi:hypothetical protein J9174_06950 [Macrococcoides canis]|uniref:nuclear transport factor 2 family protein n=1 Tax=Macrococcoides canis TaxID=1855823 RepID=UPI001AEC3500|nr:DUF4440 domain-containing protein [Macrococcus canis]QTQ07183.1 hypothetical protein J9174_06950 [Macrococcus canis]